MRHIEIDPPYVPQMITAGPPPMLQWLKIDDLRIDDAYQRDLKPDNWKRIREIADRFKWSRFSPVFVAPVEGGKYAIIDGQHRTHAASMCGFEEVPCQIVQMTQEEQAASFAAVNGMVTKVTGFQILKAAIVAGEKWALRASKVCVDAGCVLMTTSNTGQPRQPGEIYPIALIRKNAADGQGPMMTAVLKAIRKSRAGQQASSYSNDVLKPFFMAASERSFVLRPGFDLVGFVDSFDFDAALDRAADFVKAKKREGVSGVSIFDIVAAEIGEALDDASKHPADRESDEPDEEVEEEDGEIEPSESAVPEAPVPPPSPTGRYHLLNASGWYLDRSGVGFTDDIKKAWRGTADAVAAAQSMRPALRNTKAVPTE